MIICFGGEPTAKIIHSKPGPLQVCLKNINAKLPYGLLASRLRAASHVMKSVLQHEKILLTCCDSAVNSVSKTQVAVRFQSGLRYRGSILLCRFQFCPRKEDISRSLTS